jgi:hypothetical protein
MPRPAVCGGQLPAMKFFMPLLSIRPWCEDACKFRLLLALAHSESPAFAPLQLPSSYFAATLAAEIAAAKAEGRYSEGVSDLLGSSITVKGQPQVREDSRGGARLQVERFGKPLPRS